MKTLFDIQQIQQFDNLEFITREVVEGFITGLHRSPFHGISVEFAGVLQSFLVKGRS